MDIADYLANSLKASGANRDVEKSARDLRKALDEEEAAAGRLRVAQARLTEVQADGKTKASQLAAAEEEVSRAQRQHETSTDRVTQANKRYVESQREVASEAARAAKETERSSKQSEDSVGRMAKRTNDQFDALKFTGLSVGLPAAATVGAAGVTAALVGTAAGFAVLGVYAASSSEQVQNAFGDLSSRVMNDVTQMGGLVEGDVLAAIDGIGAAWGRLSPQVAAAVQGSAPAIRELSGAATDLAEGAMPGLVTSVAASEPVLKGVRTFAGQAGAGLGEFFANASQGSEGARQGFVVFGGTVQLLEARLGTLFANLANGSVGPLRTLHSMVDQVSASLIDLTAQGSGALGFLQGFGNAGNGAITVLRGLVAAASALPPQLTQMAGSWTAASLIASKFGVDAGKGFEGLGAKVKAAEGPSNKLKTAIGGLAEGALNPAFLATTALGIGLDILGEAQQKASQKAADHADNVRSLTQALREDEGAYGDHSNAVNVDALNSKNATKNLGVFGATMGTARLAIQGNSGAMRDLTDRSNAAIVSIGRQAGLNDTQVDGLKRLNAGLLQNGGAYEDVKTKVENLTGTYTSSGRSAGVMVSKLTDGQRQFLEATLNGTGAVGEQIKAQREATEAYRLSQAALSGLNVEEIAMWEATTGLSPAMYAAKAAATDLETAFAALNVVGGDVVAKGNAIIDAMLRLAGQTPTVEESLQKWNDDLRGIKDGFEKLDLKKHAKDLIDVSGAINTSSEAGSKLQNTVQQQTSDFAAYAQSLKDAGASSGEVTGKLKGMRDEFAGQLKQLGLNDTQIGKLLDHYGMIPGKVATQLSLEGDTETQTQLTNITRQLKAVPEEKGVHVQILSEAAKQSLTDLGYTIVKLPDGTFQVFADTTGAKKAANDEVARVNGLVGTAAVYANTAPAGQAVMNWLNTTTQTVGETTTSTNTDPATGKVTFWQTSTDRTGAKTTTYSNVDPATGAVQTWKLNSNGTWAKMTAYADASPAERAILDVANKAYRATINVGVNYTESIRPRVGVGGGYGGRTMNAKGNLLSPQPVSFYAGGGLRPLASNRATMVAPNTWRVVGDNMTSPELFAPLNGSRRTKDLIVQAARHEKILGFANGGMVQAEDGTWVPASFYGGAPKGPHAMYTESGFAKLRSAALANGIWSLSDMDQNQLRTYGGWKDTAQQTALQRAIQSGNASRSYGGGGSRGGSMVFNFPNYVGNRSELIAAVRTAVSNEGGNVQQVLGRRR
jgi:hypothetical protein